MHLRIWREIAIVLLSSAPQVIGRGSSFEDRAGQSLRPLQGRVASCRWVFVLNSRGVGAVPAGLGSFFCRL
jgi:hypothetical protein